MLYSLRDKGVTEKLSREVYRLSELPPVSNPDLITVSIRFPNSPALRKCPCNRYMDSTWLLAEFLNTSSVKMRSFLFLFLQSKN